MKQSESNVFKGFLHFLDLYLSYKGEEEDKAQFLKLANYELDTFLKIREKAGKENYKVKAKEGVIKWFGTLYKHPDDKIAKSILVDCRQELYKFPAKTLKKPNRR